MLESVPWVRLAAVGYRRSVQGPRNMGDGFRLVDLKGLGRGAFEMEMLSDPDV